MLALFNMGTGTFYIVEQRWLARVCANAQTYQRYQHTQCMDVDEDSDQYVFKYLEPFISQMFIVSWPTI